MTPSQLRAVEAMRPQLLGMAARYRLGRDEAEDVVQDTMIRAARYMPADTERVEPYIYRVFSSAAIDHVRRARRFFTYSLADAPSGDITDAIADPASCMDEVDARLAATSLLGRVEPLYRFAIALAADGYSYEEIAGLSGVKVGTIRSRIARGRAEAEQIAGGATL